MLLMADTKLKILREDMKLTQEQLARKANLSATVYRRAEYGHNISYTTARAILAAVNIYRRELKMPVFTMDDIELNIV